MNARTSAFAVTLAALLVSSATAEKFHLLVGVDARHYPGTERAVKGGGNVPGPVYDGDRLAGTADVGPVVPYMGTGQPLYEPNYLGSLSMLYRRGTIPIFGGVPILGIEFLGGPLLDLDGDPDNGSRSLVPVEGAAPVELPGTDSYIELEFDTAAGTVALLNFDATGCNEGGPGIRPEIATILVTIAGTEPDGTLTGPVNPDVDTRVGTLEAFTGRGSLAGVYRISGLGFELWEDAIDPSSGSADVLGTMQFLGTFRGWLIERDGNGDFPVLAGEGLGGTLWPAVDTAAIGKLINTANGLQGGTAVIAKGAGGDDYTYINPNFGNPDGNGGVALADFGGDLGAYLDEVVLPRLPYAAGRVVYLESVGYGANNSNDPVYTDTVGYDVVLVAASGSCGVYVPGDVNCDGLVNFGDINAFVAALSGGEEAWRQLVEADCEFVCVNDINRDGAVNFGDISPFVALLSEGR